MQMIIQNHFTGCDTIFLIYGAGKATASIFKKQLQTLLLPLVIDHMKKYNQL